MSVELVKHYLINILDIILLKIIFLISTKIYINTFIASLKKSNKGYEY